MLGMTFGLCPPKAACFIVILAISLETGPSKLQNFVERYLMVGWKLWLGSWPSKEDVIFSEVFSVLLLSIGFFGHDIGDNEGRGPEIADSGPTWIIQVPNNICAVLQAPRWDALWECCENEYLMRGRGNSVFRLQLCYATICVTQHRPFFVQATMLFSTGFLSNDRLHSKCTQNGSLRRNKEGILWPVLTKPLLFR